MKHSFVPTGVCSKLIDLDIEDGVVRKIVFHGGCSGNLQGIAALVEGQRVEDVKKRLKGINCGGKGTSCPDQLAKAIEAAIDAG
ncbi:MAG: TIGR03905 family TSCPD domain-containing protein [Oscillospiraceae bacterium]|nr:TIGR03905 family TSCPD domain-containing protein [Oscillospiraceae bacterium]